MRNLALPIALVTCLTLCPSSLEAQTEPADSAAKEALDVVTRLFDGMRARDTALIRSTFHATARLMTAGRTTDGTPTVEVDGVDDFIASVARAQVHLDERLYETEVRVEDGLASVWTEYDFWAGERFSHCGVDAIHLARTPDGWRIIQLTDTRRRQGCVRAPNP